MSHANKDCSVPLVIIHSKLRPSSRHLISEQEAGKALIAGQAAQLVNVPLPPEGAAERAPVSEVKHHHTAVSLLVERVRQTLKRSLGCREAGWLVDDISRE